MRRAAGYTTGPSAGYSYHMLEDENDKMVDNLSGKISALKSLSIDIGDEVRYQNKMLGEMNSEFDNTGGFLQGTMNRLSALTKKGHQWLLCYMLLFCFFVMFVAWFIVRWVR